MKTTRPIVALLFSFPAATGCYIAPMAVAPPGSCGADAEAEVAAAVNGRRAERDLPVLSVDARLAEAAAGHSSDMADHGFIGHTGSDGSTLSERIAAVGFTATRAGEVVAAGQTSPAAAVEAWMGSRRHREILLLPDVTRVGAACVADGRGALFWTAVVGAEPPG